MGVVGEVGMRGGRVLGVGDELEDGVSVCEGECAYDDERRDDGEECDEECDEED